MNTREQDVDALLKVIDAGVPLEMARAMRGLTALGEFGVPGLVQALGSTSVLVRWAAAVVLGDLKAEQAVPALEAALSDETATVRVAAADSLIKLGRLSGVPMLIEAIGSAEVIGHPPQQVGDIAIQVLESLAGGEAERPVTLSPQEEEAIRWRQWWETRRQ